MVAGWCVSLCECFLKGLSKLGPEFSTDSLKSVLKVFMFNLYFSHVVFFYGIFILPFAIFFSLCWDIVH